MTQPHSRNRMRPYQKNPGFGKFTAEKTDHVPGTAKGVSKSAKLVAKNANRSRKKAVRQKWKKELRNKL